MSTNPNENGEWVEPMTIDLHLLQIPRYQRPEPDERVDKLMRDWDDLACGALQISFRTKIYWTIDGQTRAAAARRRGLTCLPAVCCHGIDEKREAQLFLKANRDRLRVSAVSRHKAEAIAEEPRAVVIDEVLASHGLQIGNTTGLTLTAEQQLHPIFAVVACERVYDDGGGELIDRTINVIDRAFPGDSARYRGQLVGGVGYFLARDTWGADDERIVKQLAKIESLKLDEMAAHWQQVIKKRGSSKAPLYMAKAVASYVYRQNGDGWKPGVPRQ